MPKRLVGIIGGLGVYPIDKKTEEALDKVDCAATDEKCIKEAEAAGKEVERADAPAAERASTSSAGAKDASALKPGEGAWANYDFVPGERILLVEDFSESAG